MLVSLKCLWGSEQSVLDSVQCAHTFLLGSTQHPYFGWSNQLGHGIRVYFILFNKTFDADYHADKKAYIKWQ